MKLSIYLYLIAASLLANTATAGTMGPIIPPQNWRWFSSIAVGPVWASGGETQTFYLTPEIEKTYANRKSANAVAEGELFLGIQKSLSPIWLGRLGLVAATTGDAKIQGTIWDDADPQFANYNYQYKVKNTRIGVKGKLLLDKGYIVMPWVSASVGVGFNRAHNSTNTPLIFEAFPNPDFTSNTITTFTYTLGVGVQRTFTEHWLAGVGYEFADWGKSELGRSAWQRINSGLKLNHLYTNGILFNLTYLA